MVSLGTFPISGMLYLRLSFVPLRYCVDCTPLHVYKRINILFLEVLVSAPVVITKHKQLPWLDLAQERA